MIGALNLLKMFINFGYRIDTNIQLLSYADKKDFRV